MNAFRALLLIVRRSLRQHALSTSVTIAAVALASGLTMAVFSIKAQAYLAFTSGPVGFDAVLGARGSQLQLVLNTVFHLETSPGNIPWTLYESIRADDRVEVAIPYALGDNYHGFRIVGTTAEFFDVFESRPGRPLRLAAGAPFDERRRQAVLGDFAARRTGLRVGDTFNAYHGLTFDETARHDEEYVVVGLLAPTNTPADRVLWIPLEGIFRMGGHVLRGTGDDYTPERGVAIADAHKEVSAVMLRLRDQMSGLALDQLINKQGKVATLAWPIGRVMAELFDKMGWVHRILELVAYLVSLVAAGGILASVYNTINERRREFAILRSLGARRRTVFGAIVLEAAAIGAIGSVVGLAVCGAILALAAAVLREQTGVVLDVLFAHPSLWLAPPAMTLLGAAAGLLPAYKAYATDVAANLAPTT